MHSPRAKQVVISVFMEQWQLETNTFRMSFGKLAITLDKVSTLVGIPVMGHSVNTPQSIIDAREMVVHLLGLSP